MNETRNSAKEWRLGMDLVRLSYGICERLPGEDTVLREELVGSAMDVPARVALALSDADIYDLGTPDFSEARGALIRFENALLIAEDIYSIDTTGDVHRLVEQLMRLFTANESSDIFGDVDE